MSEPNPPEDRTRKSPLPKSAPTGAWVPGSGDLPIALGQIGRFEVRRLLGEGAFARVYLGFDPELEREVAIKIPKSSELTPEFRDTFIRENRLAAIIHNANICPIYEVGSDGVMPYIVMRYVAGGTLSHVLKRLLNPMPPRHAVAIARKLAQGLAAAHAQKVIHRDLKPANVLYDEANREVLIADFGLARFADQASASSNGVPKGTPAYMAPEQARGLATVVGPQSDVYSLGVILYEMLTGRVPFTGSIWEVMRDHCEKPPQLPSTLQPDLDPRLDALCLKAMAKNPTDRYSSAKAFADVLGDYLRGLPTGDEEEIEFAEEIPSSGKKPIGVPRQEVLSLDDDTEAPSSALRETSLTPPVPTRPPAPPKPAETEVLFCPHCRGRMQTKKGRTLPVDCPFCNRRFEAASGRRTVAHPANPKPKSKPAPPPLPNDRSRNRHDDRRTREDEEEVRYRREWTAAARGLRLTWIGMMLCFLFTCGMGITAVAAIIEEESSRSSGYKPSYTAMPRESGITAATSQQGPIDIYRTTVLLLGIGIVAGLLLMNLGRLLAARVPDGVRGGWNATLSGLAGGIAAACIATTVVVLAMLLDDHREKNSPDTTLTAIAGIASGAGLLLLLAGEFTFNSYLSAIARRIGPRFPHTLTAVTKVFLWIFLGCVLFGGGAAALAAGVADKNDSAMLFLSIISFAAACISAVLLPFAGIITLWLHIHASVAVGRFANVRA